MFLFFGPTAVGKSELVERLAHYMPAEIINMDLGQFYEPLTIGTAKPSWRSSHIPHHLFDILQEPRNFSVIDYRERLMLVLQDIWSRNKIPFLVGGSTFYIKNIFFPLHTPVSYKVDHSGTWDQLYAVDPQRALAIHKNDNYRIQRAWALWQATQTLPSASAPSYDPPSSYAIFFCTRDRSDLYERINKRVEYMLDIGWLQEVQNLRGTAWEPFLHEKKIIGYNEILAYLNRGEEPHRLSDLIQRIQQKTRHYARRQETFGRMLRRNLDQAHAAYQGEYRAHIHSVNLTLLDLDLYISQLLQQIQRIV